MNDTHRIAQQAERQRQYRERQASGTVGEMTGGETDALRTQTTRPDSTREASALEAPEAAYVEHAGPLVGVTYALGTVTRDTLNPSAAEQRARFEAIAGSPRPDATTIREMLLALDEDADWLTKVAEWQGPDGHRIDGPGYAKVIRSAATMIDRLGVEVVNLDLIVEDQQRQLATIARNAQPLDGSDLAELAQRARRWCENVRPEMRTPRDLIGRLVGALNDQARKARELEPLHVPPVDTLGGDVFGDAYRVIAEWITRQVDPGASEWAKLASRMRWELLATRNELEATRKLVDDARPSVRLVNDWATWEDHNLYAFAEAISAKSLGSASRVDVIVDALDEIRRVARKRLGDDGYTIPPTYSDAQRGQACEVVRSRAMRGEIKSQNLDAAIGYTDQDAYGETVDAVAQALGLERAA